MNNAARKWLKVLENGRYRQAKNSLREGNAFCCLGVACDLYRKEHKGIKWADETILNEQSFLPEQVRKWLGLKDEEGEFPSHLIPSDARLQRGGSGSLAGLNDKGFKFKEIAKFIRKNAKALFYK